jgi:hypothetical protein
MAATEVIRFPSKVQLDPRRAFPAWASFRFPLTFLSQLLQLGPYCLGTVGTSLSWDAGDDRP